MGIPRKLVISSYTEWPGTIPQRHQELSAKRQRGQIGVVCELQEIPHKPDVVTETWGRCHQRRYGRYSSDRNNLSSILRVAGRGAQSSASNREAPKLLNKYVVRHAGKCFSEIAKPHYHVLFTIKAFEYLPLIETTSPFFVDIILQIIQTFNILTDALH